MVTSPGQNGVAGSAIFGTVFLLLAAWIGSIMVTNRLVVSADGVAYWGNSLRKRFVSWPEIQSFGVGRGRSLPGWPAVVIFLNSGGARVTYVASFTASYAARIADELNALQGEFAHGPQSSGDPPSEEVP